jgi:hypothetical protein
MCSARRFKGGLKRKPQSKLTALGRSSRGVNRDVSLWIWFKRRILSNPERCDALLSANSPSELETACLKIQYKLLSDLPRSIVDRAVARCNGRYEGQLWRSVFDLCAEIKQMDTEHGIGVTVDPECGLSLVALRDLTLKKGQRLDAIQGLARAVRTADSNDTDICNSFIAPSSGSASGAERFLAGPLALAAHCCEPQLQLVSVAGAPTGTYTLEAKRKHTIAKGALVSFRYCDPAKLGFECRCPAVHSATMKAATGAAGRKRKLQAGEREYRAKRRKGEPGRP